jgi:hypothetical protein
MMTDDSPLGSLPPLGGRRRWNLGYLPSSANRELTTKTETTLASIQAARPLLAPGGTMTVRRTSRQKAGKDERKNESSRESREESCPFHAFVRRVCSR